MEIQPKKPSAKGPAEWFAGDVWIDSIAQGLPPSRLSVNAVHFAPGARTAWHSHSLGQTLYVTEGEGLVQSQGEPIVTIRVGDTAFTPADEWHWHGATPDHVMTHLSMTEGEATWGDHVSDAEYRGETRS
jgi:quercetin dioxygenase-like cupin family protein